MSLGKPLAILSLLDCHSSCRYIGDTSNYIGLPGYRANWWCALAGMAEIAILEQLIQQLQHLTQGCLGSLIYKPIPKPQTQYRLIYRKQSSTFDSDSAPKALRGEP